jgi:hypothetical protein
VSFPNRDTQFQKGKSGNPSVRPKGALGLKSILRRILDTNLPNEPDPLQEGVAMSAGEKAVLSLVVRALQLKDFDALNDGLRDSELGRAIHIPANGYHRLH